MVIIFFAFCWEILEQLLSLTHHFGKTPRKNKQIIKIKYKQIQFEEKLYVN